MARAAAVDLPDPLEKSNDPLSNPDDLLSQLAGNEIDRLLAEADVERAAPKPPARNSATNAKPREPEAPAEDPNVTSQLDDLFKELDSGEGSQSPASSSLNDARELVDAELNATARPDDLSKGAERDALLQAAGFENSSIDPSVRPHGETNDGANVPGTERTALLDAAGFESPAESATSATQYPDGDPDGDPVADAAPEDEFDQSVWEAPLPIYLKPLEWINVPLAACPPGVRNILGKLAIVTMVNAVAVLGYVIFFRKH